MFVDYVATPSLRQKYDFAVKLFSAILSTIFWLLAKLHTQNFVFLRILHFTHKFYVTHLEDNLFKDFIAHDRGKLSLF